MLGSPDEPKANAQERSSSPERSEVPQDFGNVTVAILMAIENREVFFRQELHESLQEALQTVITYAEYVRARIALLQDGTSTLCEDDRAVLTKHELAPPPEAAHIETSLHKLRSYIDLPEEEMTEELLYEIYRTALSVFHVTHPDHPDKSERLFPDLFGEKKDHPPSAHKRIANAEDSANFPHRRRF